MEMRIENEANITANLSTLKTKKMEGLSLNKKNNEKLITRMNLAYDNPSRQEVKRVENIKKEAANINFANEYAQMENAYLNGFDGFGELL